MSESIEISGHKNEVAEDEYTGPVRQAIASFLRDHPGFTIDTIDGNDVVGWCVYCRFPLLDGSDFHESEDGVMWCERHDAPEEPAA